MRILIATMQVPFVRGGAEVHAESFRDALCAAGHEAEITAIPWKWYPPEQIISHMLACRLLDVTEGDGKAVDRLIGLKFPAYLIPHPNKVIWVLHQHRAAYDLWDHPLGGDLCRCPSGPAIREAIRKADEQFLPEARAIYANSRNVAARLQRYNGIPSTPLYHPPQHADAFYCSAAEPYLFFPSRLWPLKRQGLVIEALALTQQPVCVRFTGDVSQTAFGKELQSLAKRLRVEQRIDWLGWVSDSDKRKQYAQARGVVYTPLDEDYGYITLEAMLASKPVVTCTDSGGPLEFVRHRQTGLVAEPTPAALAAALDELWADPERARFWGLSGRKRYDELEIGWPQVVSRLTA